MSHKVTGIKIVAPSTVTVGEEFEVGVKVLTDPYYVGGGCFHGIPSVISRFNENARGIRYMDNVPPAFDGTLKVEGDAGYEGPAVLSFREGSGPYPGDTRPIRRVGPIVFSDPGTKYIRLVHPQSGTEGVSNPVKVSETSPSQRLYWGDIHSQTFFSDGLRCPEELYAFAREEAFLDVFAVSDHSESLSNRQWDYFAAVANDCNLPGRFVTLVGLEWTSGQWGHRNVYYPGDCGPCLRANDPVYGELPNLYDAAVKHGALVIPHHSANAQMGVDWSLGHNEQVERLVEIHSVWGTSERPAEAGNPRPILNHGGEVAGRHVVDALNLGRRYGFVGGGDIHDGRPGDDLHRLQNRPSQYRNLYRQGIMGIWAAELTREAVFDALWNRRVFATTNVRLPLRFSIAGNPMGSRFRSNGGELSVSVEAASEVPIARIELVADGKDAQTVEPNVREVAWQTKIPNPRHDGCYYVRVTRQDGQMGWSSPIWVTV